MLSSEFDQVSFLSSRRLTLFGRLRSLAFQCISIAVSCAVVPSRARMLLLRLGGAHVGLRGQVSSGVLIRTNLLKLGSRSTLNHRCIIDNRAPVIIGDNVGIGASVHLITSNHDLSDPSVRAGAGFVAPIVIGDGVWIGSGAIVLAGVTIGPGAVVAAGAVVRENCEPHTLYGGVPARVIKSLRRDI